MQEGASNGNQPVPLVHGGVMYLNNTGMVLQALDAKTGELIWENRYGNNPTSPAMRGIAMYDHAVFVLYSLSFMSLLFVALVGLAALHAGGAVALLATFVPPLHMAAQLKETYRLGWWGTLWRTAALLVVAAVVFVLFLLLIVYVTMG